MENSMKMPVLNAFNVFLRILKIYNCENFQRNGQKQYVRNVCLAFVLTTFATLVPIMCGLAIWYIFDNGCALIIVVVVIPPTLTALQLFLSFITLAARNRIISQTIDRIQKVIDHRKKRIFFCY